jgi:hypothetical protein
MLTLPLRERALMLNVSPERGVLTIELNAEFEAEL